MNEETPSTLYADRMQFIVATMTKDYERAKNILNLMLQTEPENSTLEYYSTILEKEMNKKNEIHDDYDVTESESEASFDSNSDCDCTDSNSKSSSSSSSSSISVDDASNDQKEQLLQSKKFGYDFNPEGLVVGTYKGKIFQAGISNERKSGINQVAELKPRNELFRGKIIRVLPIVLSEKFEVRRK